jgi:signal transduction histidine kinase
MPNREATTSRETAARRETAPSRETAAGRETAPRREEPSPSEPPAVAAGINRRRVAEAPPPAPQDADAVALAQALRDPLTSILGWARLLRGGTLDEPTRARALDTIERAAESHVRVLDDILDLATISRGDLQLQIRPVDVALTVQATVESARPSATAKNVTLRCSIDPALGSVPGDPERLARIVSTLITNAVRSTPKGGRVDVRLEDAGEDLRLTVSDTGRGIRPEALARLFERDANTALRGSYGLGLAIARQLVELHGGTLRADSAGEGQGSTFTVTLPLSRPAERGQVGEAA